MSDIAKSIRQLANDADKPRYFSCSGRVTSVDLSARTAIVEPIDGTATLYDVRLQAIEEGSTGFLVVPRVGSWVTVGFLNKTTGYLAQVTEVDHYQIEANGEDLKKILSDLLDAIKVMTVTTPAGESKPPTNIQLFIDIQTRLDSLFGA